MNATDHPNEDFYRSLTRRITVIMLTVAIIPLVLISGTIRYAFRPSYQERVRTHIQELLKKHGQDIDTFLDTQLADLGFLAESYSYDQLSNETFLMERLKILNRAFNNSFTDIGVLEENGIQIAYAGPFELTKVNYSQALWFQEAMLHDTYISDVFSGLRKVPHFIVTVRREHNGGKWLLRATVNFDAFSSIVENLRLGSSGFAFILNTEGEFQTKPHVALVPKLDLYTTFLAWPKPKKGEVSVIERPDRWGNQTLYAMSRLKGGEWILGFQQNAQDAYSALYITEMITLIIFVVGALLIVVVTVLLSRRMVDHIRKADKEKEMFNERVIEAGKLASLGELAAVIAHEINNPVSVMVEEAGWVQDLLDEGSVFPKETAKEIEKSVEQIKIQGIRCKEISHELLGFARKTDLGPTHLQINDLMKEVVNLYRQRARYSSVKIIVHLQRNLPLVRASAAEMQQIMMNLFNNSFDAIGGKGGTIRIDTALEDNCVIIAVTDDGSGIPEISLSNIFDPFFTTKSIGKGTGLGLSICYGIITKMGGKMTVSSTMGVGTTFRIQIPILDSGHQNHSDV